MTTAAYEHSEGKVKVANEVIGQIAALTALQVTGVAGVADGSGRLARVIRRGGVHKGVHVDVDAANELKLQLFLVAESGRNLPALAGEVQSRVVSAVRRMLGLTTRSVDVFFADVRFSDAAS
jgi:uncharacterized alkaline shock family protein YloU